MKCTEGAGPGNHQFSLSGSGLRGPGEGFKQQTMYDNSVFQKDALLLACAFCVLLTCARNIYYQSARNDYSIW